MAAKLDANTALRDSMVRHQIYLTRLSKTISAKVREVLNATEEDLANTIRERLADATGLDTPADVRRMKQVLALLENERNSMWEDLDSTLSDELIAFAQAEPNFVADQLDTTSPVVLDLALPGLERIKAIVNSEPFEGRTLSEWAKTIASSDIARMKREIQMGMTAGEDSATIARRIVGTAKLAGRDGVTQITRNNADSIVRTAVNFISNQIRQEMLADNAEFFDSELYLATLDDCTTMLCASLDGNVYNVNEGPVPPLHFNCRSTRVPVFDGKAIGSRPAKNATEGRLVREYTAANGIEGVATRDGLPYGTKGSFDAFAQKRIRELTGPVPAATTYGEWLKSQPAAVQDDILGPTKGLLFRNGGLDDLSKYVSRQGDDLTLHELAQTQKSAFRAAGLDPEDF